MSVINTAAEKVKLSCMYEGDQSRDASSSIRGFLYQDYIVINYLLEDDVEYVCSEYLEDVDVFYSDDRFAFIQVKYYPKTSPKMDEISTDLYYQYLRLQMLDSGLRAIPTLYVHTPDDVPKPLADDIREYMAYEREVPPAKPKRKNAKQVVPVHGRLRETAVYPNTDDVSDWLKKNVHFKQEKGKEDKARSKADQKDSLFAQMAATDSLDAFLNDFVIVKPNENITEYKESLMEQLAQKYPNPDPNGDEEKWQLILLGLALSCVQERYLSGGTDFDSLRLKKDKFDSYMKKSVQTKTDQTIASYLVGIATEVTEEIIENNSLSDLQIDMLTWINRYTTQWINYICEKKERQFRLLNTLSQDAASKFANYENTTVDDRLSLMKECRGPFISFLSYFWKIMFNIAQERVEKREDIQKHLVLFDPRCYIDSSVEDYVCLHFPKDHVKHSVILPSVNGRSRIVAKKIVSRVVNMREDVPKPEKWFFSNYSNREILRGKHDYNLNMAAIKEDLTVTNLEDEGFYIECMNCIDINAGGWNMRDSCGDCIFSEECIEGGK